MFDELNKESKIIDFSSNHYETLDSDACRLLKEHLKNNKNIEIFNLKGKK
jgi:hypothetical protein